jgi:hypothetical protein
MSRVGKHPVPIPTGVTIELKGQHLKAKGKRGELQLMVHDDVSVAREGDALVFKPLRSSAASIGPITSAAKMISVPTRASTRPPSTVCVSPYAGGAGAAGGGVGWAASGAAAATPG